MSGLYGAILGDIIGSPYEFGSFKQKDFPLFSDRSEFTDDTVMTIAVAQALLDAGLGAAPSRIEESVKAQMRQWGRRYPDKGYGDRFKEWLASDDPRPYDSLGNGSAMRVSAVGWLYGSLARTREVARATAMVTHNHPEGLKGAEAVAAAIYLARIGATKEKIREYAQQEFGYDLRRTLDEIRPEYHNVTTCMQTVPEAMTCFLEGEDFIDVIRNAVSLGGDSDTLAAIAGSIAAAMYEIPHDLVETARAMLPASMLDVIRQFDKAVAEVNPPEDTSDMDAPLDAPAPPDWLAGDVSQIEEQIWGYARDGGEVFISYSPTWDTVRMQALSQELIRGEGDPELAAPLHVSLDLVKQSDSPDPDEKLLPVFTSLAHLEQWPDKMGSLAMPLESVLRLVQRSSSLSGMVLNPLLQDIVVSSAAISRAMGAPEKLPHALPEPEEMISLELPPIGNLGNDALETAISRGTERATEEAAAEALDALLERMRQGGDVLLSYYVGVDADEEHTVARNILEQGPSANRLLHFEIFPNTISGENAEGSWVPVFTSVEQMGHEGAAEDDFVARVPLERAVRLISTWPVDGLVVNPFGRYMQLSVDVLDGLLSRLDREKGEGQ